MKQSNKPSRGGAGAAAATSRKRQDRLPKGLQQLLRAFAEEHGQQQQQQLAQEGPTQFAFAIARLGAPAPHFLI